MKKFIFWTLFLFFSSGFQVLTSYRWDISESSPTLYIDLCDDMYELTIDVDDLKDDPFLVGQSGNATADIIVQSILDDYEAVVPSYLDFTLLSQNPNAADLNLAKNKTIKVCIEGSNNPFEGGHAQPDFEDGNFVGCSIVLAKAVRDDIFDFTSTLTHEIGHCIGLDHPQETVNAIMSYFHDKDQVRLMIDDKMGLIHLYPKDGYDLGETPTFGLSCSFKE